MRIYIAARFDQKEKVRKMYERCKEGGHTIPFDWTQHKQIKPYDQNAELAQEYADMDLSAVSDCDIFILETSEAGTGMYVELGAAILANIHFSEPKIYVIGEHTSRSMFYFHPSVKRRGTLEEVLEEINNPPNPRQK